MSYKEETNKVLLDLYRKTSLDNVIEVARAMLESSTHKKDSCFLAHTHGEICETVLECLILEYFKKFNLGRYGWFYKKGLILKDINNPDSGYFTELDLTVFCPQKIFAFECKSYGGDNKIVDKCTIKRKKGNPFDVYAQHSQHYKVLADQLKPFRVINKDTAGFSPYQLVLFDFSTGSTTDERTNENKLLMPCLNERNVLNIFKMVYNAPVLWNIGGLAKAMQIIEKHSKENSKKHLEYIKSIHNDAK